VFEKVQTARASAGLRVLAGAASASTSGRDDQAILGAGIVIAAGLIFCGFLSVAVILTA
jgi:hypothetical protein